MFYLESIPLDSQVWMSHGDTITSIPSTYEIIASTEDVKVAAYHIYKRTNIWNTFHPEVYHSTEVLHC